MLKKTRYVLRTPHGEKVITINNDMDLAYWNDKTSNPDYVFTEVKITKEHNVCISCEG